MEIKSKEFNVSIEGQEITLRFKRPNVSEVMDIDMEYRRSYSEAVRAGVMADAEAKKIFKKSGTWSKAEEDAISNISMQLVGLSKDLNEAKVEKHTDNLKLVQRATDLRTELMRLIQTKTDLFSNTAEALAGEQKMHKFIELCLISCDTQERYFNSREHYETFSRGQSVALSTIVKNAYFFEYGMPDDLTAGWAELSYLKRASVELAEKEAKEAEKKPEEVVSKETPVVSAPLIQAPLKKVKKG